MRREKRKDRDDRGWERRKRKIIEMRRKRGRGHGGGWNRKEWLKEHE